MMRVLWVGPAFPVEETLNNPALAPAASRWQQGLLGGLVSEGCDVRAIGHRNHRMWPNGPMAVPQSRTALSGVPVIAVAHLNMPGIRDASLSRRISAESASLMSSWGRPDIVASYNAPRAIAGACRRVSTRYGVPWIPFILDYESPSKGWANVVASVSGAQGVVFVSHWAFQNAPFSRKLHLDSGVEAVPIWCSTPSELVAPPVILYTGAMHRWGGVDVLLDAFELLTDVDASLWIVGKGISSTQRARVTSMRGVTYYGAVDETKLDELTRQAAVLANPRPVAMDGNEMNFPSKLLHYLSYAKPVVTTMTPGVSPDYSSVVIPVNGGGAAEFAAGLRVAIGLSLAEREIVADKICSFLGSRLWSVQARRFLDWSSECAAESSRR
jgi:glycosyltransferase involved in cell wall biosynthesis